MMIPITTTKDPAFIIDGHGTALLTGIPADEFCPFRIGQRLFLRAPSGAVSEAWVKSVEYALIKTGEEQYGLIFGPGLLPSDAPEGTEIHVSQPLKDT